MKKEQQQQKSTNKLPTPPAPASSDEVPLTTSWAISGPQSSKAVARRPEASAGGIPRIFNDFTEQEAICAFFLDFVLLPRHPDSIQGHLQHLLPLYTTTKPDSPLSLATSSVALVISGGSPARRSDQQLGRSIFGRALRRTSAAIRDPVDSMKDETLMAVLLLGLFEVCLSNVHYHSQSLLSHPYSFRIILIAPENRRLGRQRKDQHGKDTQRRSCSSSNASRTSERYDSALRWSFILRPLAACRFPSYLPL